LAGGTLDGTLLLAAVAVFVYFVPLMLLPMYGHYIIAILPLSLFWQTLRLPGQLGTFVL
jgi:hypothetical protein